MVLVGFVGFVSLLALMMFFPNAAAAGPSDSVTCPSPTVGQVIGEVAQLPHGSHLIVAIAWSANHVEDSGNVGYWALDSDVITFSAWAAPGGSFYALETIGTEWQTYAGALSPGAGTTEPKNGAGPAAEAAFIHFTGMFTPGTMRTFGVFSSINAGGTVADVLVGTYANQVGNTNNIDLASPYLNGFGGNFTASHWDFAFDYQYFPTAQEQCGTANVVTGAGTVVGDIVT